MRGRRINVPAGDVRPTSERARQAYFNIIGDRIDGAHFLDLFAGSGIFSFEAISRGAASATAVDSDRRNTAAIVKQAETLGVSIDVVTSDVMKWLGGPRASALGSRLIYADPPYDFSHYPELVDAIRQLTLPADALVAVEHRRGTAPFDRPPARRAEYGEVWISFFAPTSLPHDLQ